MQAKKPLEANLHFEYATAEVASLVRGIANRIGIRVSSMLLANYESGRDLYEIRTYLGYGEFTNWLSSSEWEYSPRTAYKFLFLYERSLELEIQTEWFGNQLLVSPSQLQYILRRGRESLARKVVEILKAGGKVDKEVIERINPIFKALPQVTLGISNPRIVYGPNGPIYTWNGLRFRSNSEVKIAVALEHRDNLAFWPNCKGRLSTPSGKQNLEADFLVCYKGKLGILEVDGPFHTSCRRVEEQERERLFRNHGIRVIERFDSSRCDKEPFLVVEEFLLIMEKMY
jgi:Protein of unknown function (DUF3102)